MTTEKQELRLALSHHIEKDPPQTCTWLGLVRHTPNILALHLGGRGKRIAANVKPALAT